MKRKSDRGNASKPVAEKKTGAQGLVLIADDDEYVRKILSQVVGNAGYAWTAVVDGAAAVEALQDGVFDVAIIDLEMPEKNGFEVLAAMQHQSSETIPVVLTGTGDTSRAVRAMKLGAFDFIEKPCNPALLRNAIRRANEYGSARQHAKQMREVADQWQATFDASSDVLIVTDLDGRIVRCNRAAAAHPGTTPAKLTGRHCHDALCANAHPAEQCCLTQVGHEQTLAPSEHALWGSLFEVSCAPLRDQEGRVWGQLHVARDIKARFEAQRALRESEERFRTLFNSSRDAIMTLEPPSWRFTAGNPACLTMFGIKDEQELTSLGPWEVSPDRQRDGQLSVEKAKEMIETAMREGSHFFEWRHKRLGGEEFPATVLLTRVEIGSHTFLQATVRDVSSQKQTEETLRASEEKFRQIVDNIGLGVALISTDMRILELNRQMRTWFPEIQTGDHPLCSQAFNSPPSKEPCGYCPTIKTLQDGKVHQGITATPQKDGAYNYRIVSSPIHDRDGRVVAAIEMVEDITEKLRLERELNQAQKLEAVGRLASGIAHEINTPTQYVGDNIEFLQIAYESLVDLIRASQKIVEAGRQGPIPPELSAEAKDLIKNMNLDYLMEQIPRAIEQSIEGVGRISDIVQAMKEFSHPGPAEKTCVDLNQCIRSTVTVSRNEWKYVADLEMDLANDLPQVSCLPSEFNQVILNLIVNASHAIADAVGDGAERKGTITVSTRQDGAWVVVRVADTGSGIPEEIRERIFDPFFTTKEIGRGTGQGLAIARNVVVDKHGGTLAVESEVGKGTTFTIRLPIEGMDSSRDLMSSARQAG